MGATGLLQQGGLNGRHISAAPGALKAIHGDVHRSVGEVEAQAPGRAGGGRGDQGAPTPILHAHIAFFQRLLRIGSGRDPPQCINRAAAVGDPALDQDRRQPHCIEPFGSAAEPTGEQGWPQRAGGVIEVGAGMADAGAERARQAVVWPSPYSSHNRANSVTVNQ